MTGALIAIVSNGGASGAGHAGVVAPSTLNWNDIYGEDSGSTQTLAVSGITAPIQIAATRTGSGNLSYVLNGAFINYSGAFTVRPGDSLAWAISLTGPVDRSGVVTVTNMTASTTLDSFNYTVTQSAWNASPARRLKCLH